MRSKKTRAKRSKHKRTRTGAPIPGHLDHAAAARGDDTHPNPMAGESVGPPAKRPRPNHSQRQTAAAAAGARSDPAESAAPEAKENATIPTIPQVASQSELVADHELAPREAAPSEGVVLRATVEAVKSSGVVLGASVEGVLMESIVADVGSVWWPGFDGDIQADAVAHLSHAFDFAPDDAYRIAAALVYPDAVAHVSHAFDFATPEDANRIATALIYRPAQIDEIWPLIAPAGARERDLCDVWERVCNIDSDLGYEVAACIVASFVRAGMPLNPPYPSQSTYSPLCTALQLGPPILSHALLDLPAPCNLNVDSRDNNGGPPAIGHTNSDGFGIKGCKDSDNLARALFKRLLARTERSLINTGKVYLESGCEQFRDPNTHILISNILRCGFHYFEFVRLTDSAQEFIANAQPDGDGVDLTGGSARRERCPHDDGTHDDDGRITARDLWPQTKFCGALPLVDRFLTWWSKQATINARAVARLEVIRGKLIAALQRVRTYRRMIQPHLSDPLVGGGIHMRPLYALVAAYILVPLYDESQLTDPLLGPLSPILPSLAPPSSIVHCTHQIL
jgi:hypothetical protein